MFQLVMKTRNCRILTKFHMYLSPKEKIRPMNKLTVATTFIDDDTPDSRV